MTDSNPLQGETAVITGASSGIGRETARSLAADGANVVLAARSEQRLRNLAEELDDSDTDAVAVPTDVRDDSAVNALIEETVDTFDGLDILVNNAGLARGSDVA